MRQATLWGPRLAGDGRDGAQLEGCSSMQLLYSPLQLGAAGVAASWASGGLSGAGSPPACCVAAAAGSSLLLHVLGSSWLARGWVAGSASAAAGAAPLLIRGLPPCPAWPESPWRRRLCWGLSSPPPPCCSGPAGGLLVEGTGRRPASCPWAGTGQRLAQHADIPQPTSVPASGEGAGRFRLGGWPPWGSSWLATTSCRSACTASVTSSAVGHAILVRSA